MQLRDYQETGVSHIAMSYAMGHRAPCFRLPCGGGKTPVFARIGARAAAKGNRVWILVHRVELLRQASRKLTEAGAAHGIVAAGFTPAHYEPIQVCSVQTLAHRLDKMGDVDLIIEDECFTGDMELLTATGFKRFDALSRDEVVAQIEDDGSLTFVSPLRFIQRSHVGEVISVDTTRRHSFTVTPNHQVLMRGNWSGAPQEYQKRDADDLSVGWVLPVAAWGPVGPTETLTPYERLMIATQADGSLHRLSGNGQSVSFSFVKQRKIDRFLEICAAGGFGVTEVKATGDRRRFIVHGVDGISKDVSRYFPLPSITAARARAIIEEMVCWDGHVTNRGLYYYSSVVQGMTDFYQAVAIIAGYKTNKTEQQDNRKSTYNTVHRLFISKDTHEVGLQNTKFERTPFNGTVYCVEVPSGRIVVRRRGKPVIMGNCHHAVSKSYQHVHEERSNAKLLGVTATPIRLDGRGLGIPSGPFDDLILGPSVAELIAAGYLAPPKVYAPPTEIDLSGVKTVAGDYEHGNLAKVMDAPSITGDAVAHLRRLAPDKPALVYCVSVDHAHHVAEQFRAGGFRSAAVDGRMNRDVRDAAIRGIVDGSVQVLTSCDLIGEGLDVPGASVCIGLRPTKSLAVWVQHWGRVMRPAPGKVAQIFDHSGNTMRFGLPTDEPEWSLEGRPKGRRRASEVDEVRVRQCPKCYRMCPGSATQCPECGEVFEVVGREVEQVDGELVEVTAEKVAQTWASDDDFWRQVRDARSARDMKRLTTLGAAKGYARGWAWHQMQLAKEHG